MRSLLLLAVMLCSTLIAPAVAPMVAAAAPSITIVSPLTDEIVTGSSLSVAASAVGVESASFSIDGGSTGSLAYDSATALWRATVDLSSVPAGSHSVIVTARAAGVSVGDTAWRVSFPGAATASSITTTTTLSLAPLSASTSANTAPPRVSIKTPQSNQTYSGTILVQASANAASSVAYAVDSGPTVAMSYNASNGLWQASLDTTRLSNGNGHTVDVINHGANGTTATDRAWSVNIANATVTASTPSSTPIATTRTPAPTPVAGTPSIVIRNPLSNQSYSGTIVVQASAANAGTIGYSIDGGSQIPMVLDPGTGLWQASLDPSKLSSSSHNVDVINSSSLGTLVSDRAWNVTFTNTSTLPTTISVAPATATPTTAATSTAPSSSTTQTAVPGRMWGVNYSGAEFSPSVIPGTLNSTYIYPADSSRATYFAGKGQRLVRLPILWERVQPQAFGPLSSVDIAGIRSAMDTAGAAGQKVIIDVHNYGRYHGAPLSVADAPKLANFWQQLAGTLKGHPALYGYELMNEPHDLPDGGLGWASIAQSATDGVRQSDTSAWVLVPGYGWQTATFWASNNPTLAVHDPSNHLQYAAHLYFDADYSGTYAGTYDASGAYPTIGVDRAQPFLTWLATQNAVGIFTEYGVPGTDTRWLTVLDNFMNTLAGNRSISGGTYWAAGPWWGNYALSVEPANGADKPQMSVLSKYPSS